MHLARILQDCAMYFSGYIHDLIDKVYRETSDYGFCDTTHEDRTWPRNSVQGRHHIIIVFIVKSYPFFERFSPKFGPNLETNR